MLLLLLETTPPDFVHILKNNAKNKKTSHEGKLLGSEQRKEYKLKRGGKNQSILEWNLRTTATTTVPGKKDRDGAAGRQAVVC